MKLAKAFWSLGSLLINIVIGIYVYLMSKGPKDRADRYQYINDNWDIYGAHWKVELLLMTLMTIAALYFALRSKKVSWTIVSVGQFILLLTYPIMLGGYRNTPLELAEMANEMATVVFVFGNVVFLAGIFLVYFKDVHLKKWLSTVAYAIAGFMTLVFLITYMEIISWGQAIIFAPLINVLYLINAYYGLKLKLDTSS